MPNARTAAKPTMKRADKDVRHTHAYKKLVKDQRGKRLPCWLCGQPIDYKLKGREDPDAFSYDHAKPYSTHPHLALDPDNGRSAHQRCNKARGNRAPQPSLGIASEKW